MGKTAVVKIAHNWISSINLLVLMQQDLIFYRWRMLKLSSTGQLSTVQIALWLCYFSKYSCWFYLFKMFYPFFNITTVETVKLMSYSVKFFTILPYVFQMFLVTTAASVLPWKQQDILLYSVTQQLTQKYDHLCLFDIWLCHD